jgi:hypothetical protein
MERSLDQISVHQLEEIDLAFSLLSQTCDSRGNMDSRIFHGKASDKDSNSGHEHSRTDVNRGLLVVKIK